ncbi:hypothetical protein Pfo_016768 [Paulownia fortunei]|nr:hypothetical protein Pfo_016768 [Paulownia fortunei]
MAAPHSDDVPPTDFVVPEGWELVNGVKKNGSRVKYYTNVLGQKFYSESDLLRNIEDAKKRGLSIYAPDFQASSLGTSGTRHKSKAASPSNEKHASRNNGRRGGLNSKSKGRTNSKKQKEVESHNDVECASALLDLSVENQNEVQCARALLQISVQTTGNVDCRTSRRLAGLGPELQNDFVFNRALEYIIKDRPRL